MNSVLLKDEKVDFPSCLVIYHADPPSSGPIYTLGHHLLY